MDRRSDSQHRTNNASWDMRDAQADQGSAANSRIEH